MRTKILILGLFCLLIFPLMAKDEVVFESTLKDADFRPFSSKVGMNNIGWWTLKFENGAVIRVWTGYNSKPKDDIWWVGKRYKITEDGKFLQAKLTEEKKEEK